jgi:hypothetical protein
MVLNKKTSLNMKRMKAYAYTVLSELIEYSDNNPDLDTILWDDIEEAVADRVRSRLYQLDPADVFNTGGSTYFDGRDTYYVVDHSKLGNGFPDSLMRMRTSLIESDFEKWIKRE